MLLNAGLGAATLKTSDLLGPLDRLFSDVRVNRMPKVGGRPISPISQAACEIVPFDYTGLTTHHSMGGAETIHTVQGVLGAVSTSSNKYLVHNSGESNDKDRVPVDGELRINFKATIPTAGTWYVLLPSTERFLMKGHSQVVGHGNSTTSWDAKVLFTFNQTLKLGTKVLQHSEQRILSDQTRSEDRTKNFSKDSAMPKRYVRFEAVGGEVLWLNLELEVDTSANEDGTAIGFIDHFGFLSNSDGDAGTFVVKPS
jgi:hypothetical protein